jgi:hypothetical protein
MKLCKDCKHYKFKPGWAFGNDKHECHQYKTQVIDLVQGNNEEHVRIMDCYINRGDWGDCCVEGKYWEPK